MHHQPPFVSESAQGPARFADFVAELGTGELTQSGERITIQRQPFEALRLLLLARGGLVTREEFQKALWPDDVHVDFERGLTSAMRKVREALQDSGRASKFIETLPGRGYRFICPVQFGPAGDRGTRGDRTCRPSIAATLLAGALIGAVAASSLRPRVVPAASYINGPAPIRMTSAHDSRVPAARTAFAAAMPLLASDRDEALRDAVLWFDRAAEFDPAFADAYAAGAEARIYLATNGSERRVTSLLAEAKVRASRALSLDSHSARARFVLAKLLMNDGVFEAAASQLTAVIADAPAFVPAYTALACVRKHQGLMIDAADLADHALALAPDDARIVALAGFFAHSAGRYDRERTLLDRAAAMDPMSTDVLWHVALGEARRADYGRARETLNRALALSADAPRLLYWRGYVEAASGRLDEARHTLATLSRVSATSTITGNVASLRSIIEYQAHALQTDGGTMPIDSHGSVTGENGRGR